MLFTLYVVVGYMLRVGHMGLTAGLSSAAAAYWVRKRTKEFLANNNPAESVYSRVRRRKKFGLAALAFTGCATVVSGSVDTIEKRLGYTHRTAGHSPPLLGGVWKTARLAKRAAKEAVEWVSERVGYSGETNPIVEELDQLASWILDGGFFGSITHILGDIPGTGRGGTSLNLMYPFSNKRFNLGLVSSVSTAVSKVTAVIGGVISAISLGTIGAHLVSRELPEATLKNILSTLSWSKISIHPSTLYDRATQALARLENAFRDAFAVASGGLQSWAHRARISLQNALGFLGEDPYPNPSPDPIY